MTCSGRLASHSPSHACARPQCCLPDRADPEDLKVAAQEANAAGLSLVDVFLERGLVEEAMLQPLAEELGWPWEPMLQPKLEEASELKRLCPARLALRHRLLPLGVEETAASALASGEGTAEPAAPGRVLLLACYDPFDFMARQAVARTVSLPVRWCLAPRGEVLRSIQPFTAWGRTLLMTS